MPDTIGTKYVGTCGVGVLYPRGGGVRTPRKKRGIRMSKDE
jgi:hypothetical protein